MPSDNALGNTRGFRPSISSHFIEAVTKHYGLKSGLRVDDLGGSSNLNLSVVTESDHYVVRSYRIHVKPARLQAIQRVRSTLIEGGLPFAETIRTVDGDTWIEVDGSLVEVEHYVKHDSHMSSWHLIEVALPSLAQMHNILCTVDSNQEIKDSQFANYVPASDLVTKTSLGTQRLRRLARNTVEQRLADQADELAELLSTAGSEASIDRPKQLVHGDFWDKNAGFRNGSLSFVGDLDFMGERHRIDDLALTFYFACMKQFENPVSDVQLKRLVRLTSSYSRQLREPLTARERAALPFAMARQPLWSIGGWVVILDDDDVAFDHAVGVAPAVAWGLGILRDLDRWQEALHW